MHEYDYDVYRESAYQTGKKVGYDAAIQDVINMLRNYPFANGCPSQEEVDKLIHSIKARYD